MTDGKSLDQRITQGREEKARAFCRALWDQWHPAERLGLGVRKLRHEPASFWRELADSIGRREPSPETIKLIMAKLDIATNRERARPTTKHAP